MIVIDVFDVVVRIHLYSVHRVTRKPFQAPPAQPQCSLNQSDFILFRSPRSFPSAQMLTCRISSKAWSIQFSYVLFRSGHLDPFRVPRSDVESILNLNFLWILLRSLGTNSIARTSGHLDPIRSPGFFWFWNLQDKYTNKQKYKQI